MNNICVVLYHLFYMVLTDMILLHPPGGSFLFHFMDEEIGWRTHLRSQSWSVESSRWIIRCSPRYCYSSFHVVSKVGSVPRVHMVVEHHHSWISLWPLAQVTCTERHKEITYLVSCPSWVSSWHYFCICSVLLRWINCRTVIFLNVHISNITVAFKTVTSGGLAKPTSFSF